MAFRIHDSVVRGETFQDPSFIVAHLKRALDHLHELQSGLEAAAQRKKLADTLAISAWQELFELREGILKLMDQYRGR